MMKILVVSTHTDIENRLSEMLTAKQLPDAHYSIVVEFFQEQTHVPHVFENVFTIDDLRNRAAIENSITQCQTWGPFDQVVATDEYAIVLAAELRDRLNVAGPRLADIVRFRDKVAMKESLVGSPVRAPKLYEPEELLNDPRLLPVVVKPRSYAGSKGVRILKTREDVVQATQLTSPKADHAFREFSMEDMEFEEYIDGTVFHIDGLVYRSEIIFCLASQYHGTCLDYINGRPLASTSVEDVAEQRRWLAFASDVHKAMRLPDGAFHLEAFLTKNSERLFLEIGARPGGAYIVPSIARATGVNLDVAHLQCQLGIRPSLQPQSAQHYAWLIFPKAVETGTHAIVEKIEAPDLTRLGSLAWSQLPVAGDKYSGPFSYMSNLGAFVFVSPDKDLITANLRSLLEEYHVLPGASA